MADMDGGGQRDPSSDFVLKERLGEGSYGSVWRAEHTKSGMSTAIKRVPVDNDLEEIINEIKIMKQCKSPHIVNYYGSYFKDQELWIVMEHCSGGSANDLMRITDKMFTEDQISSIMRDSLKGLSYLHSVRKIHRDIKAGNILLNSRGNCKLADFGVSGQLADNMAKRQTVIGTPFWMAPEVIQEVGYDVKADIWSLGITAIELAEGKPPNSNIHPMRAIFMIPSRPPPKLTEQSSWTQNLHTFIARCLVKNPDERGSANDMLQHVFIVQSKPPTVLLPILQEAEAIIQRDGREQALGLLDDSDDEEEVMKTSARRTGVEDESSSVGDGFSTMVYNGDDGDSGTMKYSGTMNYSGTMVASGSGTSGNDDSTPYFMQHIAGKDKPASPGPAPAVQGRSHPEYARYTKQQLEQMLAANQEKMGKEIDQIRQKYAQQKQQLQQKMQQLR